MIEKDISGCILGYHVSHEAWYANANDQPEINFGLFEPGQGTCGEMSIEWVDLDGLTPKLRIFCNAWYALNTFADKLLPILAEYDDERITPQGFAAILDSVGFTDLTKRERKGGSRKTLYTLKETRRRLDRAEHQRNGLVAALMRCRQGYENIIELNIHPSEKSLENEIGIINEALTTLKEGDA